jgi:hypothetical protein
MSKKVPLEKVEVRYTKDGNGSGLFALEDIDKDDCHRIHGEN